MTQNTTPAPRTMYRVRHNGQTQFIGTLGNCWINLRDRLGNVPAHDLKAAGWSIEPARPGAMSRALKGISA